MAVKVQNKVETEVWGDVEVICPICRTKRNINIPMRIIDQSKQLTSLFIPTGRVCDHAFIPFIDKQLKVRGYQKLDALLDDIEENKDTITEISPQNIDILAIKMNIRPEMMINAIKGIIFQKRILLVLENDLDFLKNTLFDFFEYLFQRSFNTHILIHTKETYKINKGHYTDYLILEGKDISGKIKKSINSYEIRLEEDYVKNFYKEGDSSFGLKNLRDKIRELYALSYKLLEYYQKQGLNQALQMRKAIRYLEDTHFMKISKKYFKFLIYIVKNYFNTEIILVQDIMAEKIDQMWGK